MADAVEEALKRINSHKGILGIIIINGDGVPIRSTLENALTVQYAALVSQFTIKTRAALRKLSPGEAEDDLRLIRVRSSLHEIIIAPDFDKVHDYQLIVVQDPSTL
eukprot:jgi/Botrbrau1/21270/Bobra.39_2s0060.1